MNGLVSEGVLAVLQAEEGAAAGPAVADYDKRGAAACSSAQGFNRGGWMYTNPQARRVLSVLQCY